MSPKQLLDKLYNNAWETKNWKLTRSSKNTLIGAVLIIATAAAVTSLNEKK